MYKSYEDRYQKMQYKRCGNSGVKLPRISLGMWHNFGNKDIFFNAREMILGSFDLGITHFDLANNYGPLPGSAEETFGKVFRDDLSKYRNELLISTKAGYRMWPGPYGEWGSRKNLLSSLDDSLKRMNLEYVDIFYSHRFDPNTPLEETMSALAQAVFQGKALYVGISSYQPDKTEEAIKILRDLGVPCLIHQPQYSILERWVEDGLHDVLTQEQVGCAVFCPLAQGVLTNKYLSNIPENSRAAGSSEFLQESSITQEVVVAMNKLNKLAISRGQNLAQMAISWVLSKSFVTSAIIGASRLDQIKDCVKAVDNIEFSPEELVQIDTIVQMNR
jgi:L-glyceraldehyde 3-phosphate reductase